MNCLLSVETSAAQAEGHATCCRGCASGAGCTCSGPASLPGGGGPGGFGGGRRGGGGGGESDGDSSESDPESDGEEDEEGRAAEEGEGLEFAAGVSAVLKQVENTASFMPKGIFYATTPARVPSDFT